MKYLIYILLYAGWSIYKANRKAQEKQRQARLARATTSLVSEPETVSEDIPGSSDAYTAPTWADRYTSADTTIVTAGDHGAERFAMDESNRQQQDQQDTMIYASLEQATGRLRAATKRTVKDDVSPIYNSDNLMPARTTLAFDKASLRNYIVIKEVFGEPRSKAAYRPPHARKTH